MRTSNAAVKPVKGMTVSKDSGDYKSNEVVGVPFWWNYPNVI